MEEKRADAEIKVQNGFIKWLDNFWYHYKWPTIGVTLAAIVLAVCLWQTATTDKYDMLVVYAGRTSLTVDQTDQLATVLEHIMPEDYDGDGKKNVSMNMYHIYSADQIKEIEASTDSEGVRGQVDRHFITTQKEAYNNYMMTGDASICFLEPWLYEEIGKEYLCPLSEIFGDELPASAIDGYGIRLGDTDLYRDYGALRRLPADTVICLQTPFLSESFLSRKGDSKKFEFEKSVLSAIALYESENAADATDVQSEMTLKDDDDQ